MLRSPWIRNRFTITFGAIALAVVVWNFYVALNDGGHVSGQVVNAEGRPVDGAIVVLARKTVASVEKVAQASTDARGRYSFDHHGQYAIVLTATATDGQSERRIMPLWFRNQNVDVAPIVLRR
jgi:hypothetical protein